MVKQLVDMDSFKVSMLSNDKLQKFYEFLQRPDYVKFFMWLNEQGEVELSYDGAPKFFGKLQLLIQILILYWL